MLGGVAPDDNDDDDDDDNDDPLQTQSWIDALSITNQSVKRLISRVALDYLNHFYSIEINSLSSIEDRLSEIINSRF